MSSIQNEGSRRPLDRALSWDENESVAVERRASDVKLKALDRVRCHTMDYGTNFKPDFSRDHEIPKFDLEETVFEADEELDKAEDEPLINKSNGEAADNKPTSDDGGEKKVSFEDDVKDEKSPRKAQPIREDSHAGHLLRQNAVAVNDVDITSQDVNKKSDILERQKSV